MVKFEKEFIVMTFLSKDKPPIQFLIFLQELSKIKDGNINSVAFNKHKKNVQELIASWLELSGGMMFNRFLFEFEEDFNAFSENLYKDIKSLEKKFKQKQQEKIIKRINAYVREIKKIQPISVIFEICCYYEEDITQEFIDKQPSSKKSWDQTKAFLGIDAKFEAALEKEEQEIKHEKEFWDWIDTYYVVTPNGPVPKSFLKNQPISIESHYRYKGRKRS